MSTEMNMNVKPELNLKIRHMRKSDVDNIMRIEKKAFNSPWHKDGFKSELTLNRFAHYFVLCSGSRLIAYAGMWVIIDESHLTTLAVDESYRGLGVGKLLLEFMITKAYQSGAVRMSLEVRPSNKSARRLYAGHGFVVRGKRENYYPDEDAFIMINDELDKWAKESRRRLNSVFGK